MTLSTTHAATDTGVRDWAAGAATGLAAIVGPWINDEIAFGIRWRTLAASIAVLVLVGVADAILRWLVRRKIRRDEATAETTPGRLREARYWLGRGLRATVPPLELLLWIHGVHAAVAIVLAALTFREEAAVALAALSAVRGVGTLAVKLLSKLGSRCPPCMPPSAAMMETSPNSSVRPICAVRCTRN